MLPKIQISSRSRVSPGSLTLGKGSTLIGRGQSCRIVLEDPSVSRDHGAFTYYLGILTVEDHDSANGTFVNGVRVKRQVLYAGDRVAVGEFKIVVTSGSELVSRYDARSSLSTS